MKKVYRIVLGIIITALLLTLFVACNFDESKNHLSGAQLLDDNALSEIKNDIINEETSSIEASSSGDIEIESSPATVEGISSETKRNESEATEAESYTGPDFGTEDNNVKETVYWTESGSVWHTTNKCRYLKNSKNVLSGSIEEAKEAGKTKVCSGCGK